MAIGEEMERAGVAHAHGALPLLGVADGVAAAHETAIGTKDMPIVASVGVAVSDLAARTAQPVDAAEMLGAAARLRGADDATNLDIRRLMATLREALGDAGFEDAYERGRALDREAAIARLDPAVLD